MAAAPSGVPTTKGWMPMTTVVASLRLEPRPQQHRDLQRRSGQRKGQSDRLGADTRRTPRFFALDPAGHLLYAANLDSDNIVVFTVDTATGKLTPTGQVVETGSPSCIIFARA